MLAVDRAGLLIERFDDEALVFNPGSWQTHFLNPAGTALFEALIDRPQSVEELANLVTATDDPEYLEVAALVTQALDSLRTLGLIAPLASSQACA